MNDVVPANMYTNKKRHNGVEILPCFSPIISLVCGRYTYYMYWGISGRSCVLHATTLHGSTQSNVKNTP